MSKRKANDADEMDEANAIRLELSPERDDDDSDNNNMAGDTPFDPSIDMLVNDYDDERTLEEQEAIEAGEAIDPQEELINLQKESDMPLEELLGRYGYMADAETKPQQSQDAEANENEIMTLSDESLISWGDDDRNATVDVERMNILSGSSRGQPFKSTLRKFYNTAMDDMEKNISLSDVDETDEMDERSSDDEMSKRPIMVGSEFQAVIPDGLSSYDDALPYENEDKLLWDANQLQPEQVERYMEAVTNKPANATDKSLRDDERALFLLQQCGHNTDEALRRRRLNAVGGPSETTSWSDEECRNFENGLKTYGKDFYEIQRQMVRTRSVGELVRFYYTWKKSERHDTVSVKLRLEKKKYLLHPGTTDYMERFLDEDESIRDPIRAANENADAAMDVAVIDAAVIDATNNV